MAARLDDGSGGADTKKDDKSGRLIDGQIHPTSRSIRLAFGTPE
jgi:hypothetical protein